MNLKLVKWENDPLGLTIEERRYFRKQIKLLHILVPFKNTYETVFVIDQTWWYKCFGTFIPSPNILESWNCTATSLTSFIAQNLFMKLVFLLPYNSVVLINSQPK